MPTRLAYVSNQKTALRQLADLAQRGSVHEDVLRTARQIKVSADISDRDDAAEVRAVYNAVKRGIKGVPGLARGVQYVSDPRYADHFTAPWKLLEMCRAGACAGDCDDHAALVSALLGALGFKTGLKAFGPPDQKDYTHVFAVVAYPKHDPKGELGLDTTVPTAYPGWQPSPGRTLTVWLE